MVVQQTKKIGRTKAMTQSEILWWMGANRAHPAYSWRRIRICGLLLVKVLNLFQTASQCAFISGLLKSRDVPDIHPVPGKCRISHCSVLPRPGKIMGPSNKKKKIFTFVFTQGINDPSGRQKL